ncbi:probable RNA-directed DNA polymerase from transposon X-element [Trichonephila clavipes]|nr:probable RNA-directed DNA polymerase from transposon X-element [Trichonephila clavipes]
MFGTRVAFEPYDGSRNRRPNQCWRCQGFFHSSEVCHLPMKCLKCAGPHQAKDCTLQFEDPLKCANCGGEHAVNWRQCPRFPKSKKASKQSVQSLSICFWNANGLRPKICEVRDFVSEQNPDLLLVQETKLQPGLDPLIANYRLHKDDRNNFPRSRIDGGTAIYCKNNYDHNRVPLPTLQYMDATAIEIKFNNFPPIRIVSAYARNTPENNRKFPDKDFLKILNSGQNIIIAGDLNAAHRTWSNARSNAFGYALRKIVNNKSNVRIVASHTPTHINASSRPSARDSIIDLAVLKNIPFNHDIRVIDDLESDHLPVILTLYTGSALIKIPDQLSTNWENFKFLLNNKPLPIPPSFSNDERPRNDDLEIAIRRLGENISEALIEASKPKFKQPPLKLPSEIKAKIRHRNRIRKFWQRTRDPAVKSEFRTLSREVTKDIRHFFQSRWESQIVALTPETGTLWRKISLFKKPPQNIPPLNWHPPLLTTTPHQREDVSAIDRFNVHRCPTRRVFSDTGLELVTRQATSDTYTTRLPRPHPLEKAEVIADSLQQQFEPNTEAENDRFTARTQRKIKRFLDTPTCLDLEKTTPGEVQEYIKKLKINKSPGLDLITNRILKNLPLKFVLFIVMLFNLLMENCHFPKNWKFAVVVPILKPNSDDTQLQNYRPISLLSSLSKAYEFVLLNRLNQHCIARNIIIPEQHGFVTQCSTVTQLLRVTELIHHGFQKNPRPRISNESIREIPAYDNSIPSSSKRPRAVLNHSYQHFPALKRMRMS